MRDEADRVAARVRELLGRDADSDERVVSGLPSFLMSRRAALVAICAAVIVVVAVGAWLRGARSGAQPVTVPLATATTAGAAPSSTSAPSSPARVAPSVVVVDIAGKVRHPGVYRLPAGSRVDDALRAAGGSRSGVNLNGLNLAAVVVDGEQIAVGIRGALGVTGATSAAGGPGGGMGAPVDVNTATLDQLETLPGVGPVLGQQILDWRAHHGQFANVDQLDDVPGIGAARLAELRTLVTV